MNNLYLLLKTLFFVAISAGAIISTHASLLLPKTSPTLTVIGLPKGTPFTYRIAPNYTTVTAISTGYTTQIPIYISPQTNTTYHGAVPWQYQGAGTTVTYNGTTYTMYNCPQILSTTNASKNICSFYYYLSQNTLFDSNQTALLEASNASLASAKLAIAAITHSNESLPYGQFKLSGKYAKAGTIYKNASYKAGDVHFIKLAVIPNQSYASIQLSSKLFNETLTEPGTYHLPVAVYHGCWGISSDCSPLNVTVTIKAKLISPNRVPFNALIQAGANTILSFSDNSSSAIDISKSFSLSPTEGYNFTFEGLGNSNYSYDDPVVTPANILYYIPVNIINTQSTAVAANTPIAIGTSSSGSIIGFNALPYSSYFTQNNFEFFYANGTIIPSWLEAWNTSNEISTSLSSNMLEWINLGANTPNELPASMTSNYIIYMGFAGNVVSSSNTLFNNVNTGEAPQLSPSYAEYDDGVNIFNFYDNFAGTILNSAKWTVSGTSYSVDNGITISSASTTYIQSASEYNPQTQILDFYSYVSALGIGDYYQGWASAGESTAYMISDAAGNDYYNLYNYNGITTGTAEIAGGSTTAFQVWSVYASSTTSYATLNYGTLTSLTTAFEATTADYIFFYQAVQNSQYTKWVRTRTAPPNGVMPTTSLGAIQTASPLSVSISPLLATYDTGQSISITATAAGGATPYSYQWYNDTSGTATAMNGQTSATLTKPAGATSQTVKYYVKVTDSASSTATSSTGSYVINTALTTPSIIPSNTAIDYGQYVSFTSSWTGGTPDYTAKLYSSSTSACNTESNLVQTLSSLTSGTSSFSAISPTSLTYYCIFVTDSATTSATTNSISKPVLVYPAPTITGLTPSNTILDSGQSVVYNTIINGGSYSANVAYFNGASSNVITELSNPYGNTQGETFIAWVNPNVLETASYGGIIFGYQGWVSDYEGRLSFYTNELDPLGTGESLNLPTHEWSMITATVSSNVNPTITLYVNSKKIISSNFVGTIGSTDCQYAVNVVIGSISNPNCGASSGTEPFEGYISDAQIYNYTLSQDSINAIYQGGIEGSALSSNLLGWWKLNNTINSNVIDYSGNNNQGQPNNIQYTYPTNSPYGSYTANLINTNSGIANSIIGGDNSNVFGANVPALGTQTFYVVVNDLGVTTPYPFSSPDNSILVNSALGTPAITPSSATYDTGQSVSLTATASGGTTPYSYQWYNDTSGTGVSIPGATSAIFTETTGATAKTVTYYVTVTDSATTNEIENSPTADISISNSPSSSSFSSSSSSGSGGIVGNSTNINYPGSRSSYEIFYKV